MEKDDYAFASSVMREGGATVDGADAKKSSPSPSASKSTKPRFTDAQGRQLTGMGAVAASLMSDQLARHAVAPPPAGMNSAAALEMSWFSMTGGGGSAAGGSRIGTSRRDALANAYASATRPDMFGVASHPQLPPQQQPTDDLAKLLGVPVGQQGTDPSSSTRAAEAARAHAECVHPPLRLRRRLERPVATHDDTHSTTTTTTATTTKGEDVVSGQTTIDSSVPYTTTSASPKLPTLCAWFRVPRRLAKIPLAASDAGHAGSPLPRPETGYHWARQDDILEDETLVSRVACDPASTAETVALAVEAAAGGGIASFGLPIAGVAPESGLSDFFSFSRAEFDAVMGASSAADHGQSPCAFTFEETRKLFRLYELFGSFPVVADRWAVYDEAGAPLEIDPPSRKRDRSDDDDAHVPDFFRRPLPVRQVTEAAAEARSSSSSSPLVQPSQTVRVESLCAQYARVCSGVMAGRHARLERLLGGGGGGGDRDSRRGRAGKEDVDVRKPVQENHSTPPLLQFLEKHPAWQRPTGTTDDTDAVITASPSPPLSLEQLRHQCKSAATVLNALSEPSPWYDAARESGRRDALAELLHGEGAVNVPYQREVLAYVEQMKRAAQSLERARQQLAELPSQPEAQQEEGNKTPLPLADAPLCTTVPETQLYVTWKPLPAGVDPALVQSARRVVETHNTAHPLHASSASVLPPPVHTAASTSTVGVVTNPGEAETGHRDGDHESDTAGAVPASAPSRNKSRSQRASAAVSTAAAAARAPATISAVVDEVVNAIPWQCGRFVGAARAGWMLPPPRPLSTVNIPGESENLVYTHRLEKVHACGVVNRATSAISESVLVSFSSAVPRVYREVEQELEKHLLEDHRALMLDSSVIVSATEDIRCLYTQNLSLRRLLQRLEAVLEGVDKLHRDGEKQKPA